jgi:hypothetical protein
VPDVPSSERTGGGGGIDGVAVLARRRREAGVEALAGPTRLHDDDLRCDAAVDRLLDPLRRKVAGVRNDAT